jgi:oxygen-independent coproporphyrinogen-3 oxidase
VIERLMCDFAFQRQKLVNTFGTAALGLWREACALAQGEFSGFVSIVNGRFVILETSHHLARQIASGFDAYLATSAFKYSKAV